MAAQGLPRNSAVVKTLRLRSQEAWEHSIMSLKTRSDQEAETLRSLTVGDKV